MPFVFHPVIPGSIRSGRETGQDGTIGSALAHLSEIEHNCNSHEADGQGKKPFVLGTPIESKVS
jgi:hypothetical protein